MTMQREQPEPTSPGAVVDVGRMGEQFERAGETALAAIWYERAGRQAQVAWQADAAIDYYTRALALLPLGDEYAARRMDMQEGLAEMLFAQSRLDEAIAAYDAMLKAAEVAGDRQDCAHALNGLAMAEAEAGPYQAALAHATEAEELARAAGAQHELAAAMQRQGLAQLGIGDKGEARKLAEQALLFNSALSAWDEAGHCFNLLARAEDDDEQSRQLANNALIAYRKAGNRWGIMMMLCYLGDRLRGAGMSYVDSYGEALSISREIGNLKVVQMISGTQTMGMKEMT